jgi:hypothetical protein
MNRYKLVGIRRTARADGTVECECELSRDRSRYLVTLTVTEAESHDLCMLELRALKQLEISRPPSLRSPPRAISYL